MAADEFVHAIARELVARFRVHTVLLYGSHADGSASAESDYDIAAFGPVEYAIRDARVIEGRYLDAFIYPESVFESPTEEFLKLRGSVVLLQRDLLGTDLLKHLDDLHASGPEALPGDEATARRAWAHKMLKRAERGDVEGNYRRAWLLTALLEDYFRLRGRWFEGPKKAMRWLQRHDGATFLAFTAALEPGAEIAAISRLIPLVVDEPRSRS